MMDLEEIEAFGEGTEAMAKALVTSMLRNHDPDNPSLQTINLMRSIGTEIAKHIPPECESHELDVAIGRGGAIAAQAAAIAVTAIRIIEILGFAFELDLSSPYDLTAAATEA